MNVISLILVFKCHTKVPQLSDDVVQKPSSYLFEIEFYCDLEYIYSDMHNLLRTTYVGKKKTNILVY